MEFKEKISVIAPAHNEEGNVKEYVERVDKTMKTHSLIGEILIVNDGSTDKTLIILESLQKKYKNLRVVSHRKNKGLTSAIRTGIENAQYEYIILLHSDLESYPEEDIPRLLKPLTEGYDFVIGRKNHEQRTLVKAVSSLAFNFLCRKLFKANIHDIGWVKAFKKEVYYNVETLRSDWHRFFVFLAANEGYKIKEVPASFHQRKTGKSHFGKLGIKRARGAFLDLIVIKFLLSFSKRPMHIFGTTGGIMVSLGLLVALYDLYLFLAYGSLVDRTPSLLLSVFLILTGLQFFATGFLAELIVSISEKRFPRRD